MAARRKDDWTQLPRQQLESQKKEDWTSSAKLARGAKYNWTGWILRMGTGAPGSWRRCCFSVGRTKKTSADHDEPPRADCDAGRVGAPLPFAHIFGELAEGELSAKARALLPHSNLGGALDEPAPWSPGPRSTGRGKARDRETADTLLCRAARANRPHTVSWLLGNGAGVDVATGRGATPLYLSAQEGHEAVTATLLRHGADVHARANNGKYPL